MACLTTARGVWVTKAAYDDAELKYHAKVDGIAALAATPSSEFIERLSSVETENKQLKDVVSGLQKLVIGLQDRIKALEGKTGGAAPSKPAAAAAPAKKPADDDDDGVDLFASDEEEESAEAIAIREKRLAEYAAKKSKKPALIAKSNIIMEVKPWDDETSMKDLEAAVRKITTDGLLWGVSKLVPVGYGINKLQISCVVEDEKVSVDWLTEEIEKNEDLVQSVDIAAFNKI